MKLNEREKVLVLVAPAFLAVAVYVVIFGASAQRKLTNTREQLAGARQGAVTPQQVWRQQARVKQLAGEVEDAQTAVAELRIEADESCGQVTARRRDMIAVDSLTALFDRCHLTLTDESIADGSDAGGMADSLEAATRRLQDALQEDQTDPKSKRNTSTYATALTRRGSRQQSDADFRSVRFYGRFLDVVRVLNELARGEDQPIPVVITMEEIGLTGMYSEARTWTMLVRI